MGEAGRRRAVEHFAWPAIASRRSALYGAPGSERAERLALARGAARARARMLAAGADERGPPRAEPLRADARGRARAAAGGPSAGRAPSRDGGALAAAAEHANAARRLEDGPARVPRPAGHASAHRRRARPRLDAARLRGRLRASSPQRRARSARRRSTGARISRPATSAPSSPACPRRRVLVWCGGGHLFRRAVRDRARARSEPARGSRWAASSPAYCGVEPFAIDQNVTVAFGGHERPWLEPLRRRRCATAAAPPASSRPICRTRSPNGSTSVADALRALARQRPRRVEARWPLRGPTRTSGSDPHRAGWTAGLMQA